MNGLDARGFERFEFVRSRSFTSGDNRSGMAHSLAWRSSGPCDVGNHRLADVLANEFRAGLFVRPADLADHNDAFRLRIVFEACKHVDKIHAAYRIAADADARALTQADIRGLEDGLVRERAGTRDDADLAFLMNEARHDADFAFAGRDDAGTIWTDEQTAVTCKRR